MKLALFLTLAASAFAAVDGTVINATTGKPQPSVIVTLVQPGSQGMQTLASVKTDAEGKFKIDKEIPPGPALLQALYQGATYNQMLAPGAPSSGVRVKIYDSSAKPGIAKISQHMILLEPSAEKLDVSETFMIENQSPMTFQDPVKGSVQFYLPEAAGGKVQVTINAPGGMPIQRPAEKTAQKNVYKIAYPVKPGESRFDVSYSLPASPTFSSKIMHGEGLTRLVTPAAVTLSGDGIESLGQEPQTKAHIYNAGGADYSVTIAGTGSLRSAEPAPTEDDSGAPQPEAKMARVYDKLPWILAFGLGILGLGGWLLYRKGSV